MSSDKGDKRTDLVIMSDQEEDSPSIKKRLNALTDILLRYAVMDFSKKVPITENGDELDAVSAGINVLVEEVNYRIEKAEQSEERFRLLVESAKDYAFFMINPEGYIVTWNKGAENIKGYKAEEVIGKHISIFYTKEEIERGEPELNLRIAKEKGHYETESLRRKKNGSLFYAEIVFTALYDETGNLKGYAKVTHDITGRLSSESELKSKEEELLRSNSELEQFAYIASHDLQEPLRMITSYMQLLEKRYKDKLDQDASDFIGFAVDGANRMRTLINSLLEYSRVNRIKPLEKVKVNDLLENVLQNLEDQIKDNKAEIKIDKLPEICADPVLISQLFQNLITNAIKFRGEKDPVIHISGKNQDGEFLFSVKDNGIGIEEEYANKIFVIFQRLHSKEKYPGTGIGLAICKKIVERHGGKIWIESEIGKGTTFYFTIKKSLSDERQDQNIIG